MVQLIRYVMHSKVLVIMLPSITLIGFFIFLKFLFVLFSDRHELKVSSPSEKLVSSIRSIRSEREDSIRRRRKLLMIEDTFYKRKKTFIEEIRSGE